MNRLLALAVLALAVVVLAACVPTGGAPLAAPWGPCEDAATACPLPDDTFGACLETPQGHVCAPWGDCARHDLGDGDDESGPLETNGVCVWSCAEDGDCPADMFCDGVCVY